MRNLSLKRQLIQHCSLSLSDSRTFALVLTLVTQPPPSLFRGWVGGRAKRLEPGDLDSQAVPGINILVHLE